MNSKAHDAIWQVCLEIQERGEYIGLWGRGEAELGTLQGDTLTLSFDQWNTDDGDVAVGQTFYEYIGSGLYKAFGIDTDIMDVDTNFVELKLTVPGEFAADGTIKLQPPSWIKNRAGLYRTCDYKGRWWQLEQVGKWMGASRREWWMGTTDDPGADQYETMAQAVKALAGHLEEELNLALGLVRYEGLRIVPNDTEEIVSNDTGETEGEEVSFSHGSGASPLQTSQEAKKMSDEKNTQTDEVVEEAVSEEATPQTDPLTDRLPLAASLSEKGFTLEDARAVRANNQLTDEQVASGEWVKLVDVDRLCKANNIPISRFVRAFGGDRALLPPMHEMYTVRWHGRTRYLPIAAASDESIEFLKAMAPAKRVRKAKAEKPEGEGEATETPEAEAPAEAPKKRRRRKAQPKADEAAE